MKKRGGIKYLLLSILSLCVFFGVWWFVTDGLKLTSDTTLPSPIHVLRTFFDKFTNTKPDGSTLLQHLGSSLQVTLSGYALGVVIGIPLGIVMAWYRKFDMLVRPLFDMVRPVPGIAWIPLMIALFGIGLLSKAMVIFIASFVPCVLNAYTGVRQTRAVHLWVGRTFGASDWQLLTRIAIPTALPLVMTALRVALGSAWTTIVAAEMLASTRGLGFMIQQCRGIYRVDVIIAGMIAIGLVGAGLTYLLTLLEKKVVKGVHRT